MKSHPIRRTAIGLVACLSAVAVTSPAGADILKDLGIDLGQILGGGRGEDGRGGADGLRLAETILEKELPRQVGPASRYDVRIDRAGTDLLRGRLSRVDVTGLDVRTSDGLVIPKMDLTLRDVRLGLGSRKLESVSKGDFALGLGEEVVTRYVQKRGGPKVRDAKVRFSNGQIAVKATPELFGVGLPSEVEGKPVLTGGDAINFRASKLSVLGVRIPQLAVDALEREINPVVDLSGLKLPVKITDFSVKGSKLVAEGGLSFGR